jgi:hypothetical protein
MDARMCPEERQAFVAETRVGIKSISPQSAQRALRIISRKQYHRRER